MLASAHEVTILALTWRQKNIKQVISKVETTLVYLLFGYQPIVLAHLQIVQN